MPEPKFDSQKTVPVENIGDYEREKIERTLADARHLVAVMENYLTTMQFCDEKGILVEERERHQGLRQPGALGDPAGVLRDLAIKFEQGMADAAKYIHVSQKDELLSRYPKKDA